MNDTTQNTCSKCGKKTEPSGEGFATRMLDLCVCKMLQEEQSNTVPVCKKCNKRVSVKAGTMTQWVFAANRCSCAEAEVEEKPVDSFVIPGGQTLVVDFDDSAEKELSIDENAFPIDRYKPIAEIGKGAIGTVFLCRDRLLRKRVAIKILNSLTDEQLVLFQEEARATARLIHPNIVRVLDFGSTAAGNPYMVMDYLQGISLQRFIDDCGTLELDMVKAIFGKLCDALHYAHGRNVFHRDVKPSNIILLETDEGVDIRLIDFGVARVKETSGSVTAYQGRTLVGTPEFMPPDVINGAVYDARSEIYSVGCMLFASLEGSPPFRGASILDTLAKHVNDSVPEITNRPGKLVNIVRKCLEKEKQDRFGSMEELKNALAEPLADDPIYTGVKRPRKRPNRRVLVAAAVCSIFAVVILAFQFSDQLAFGVTRVLAELGNPAMQVEMGEHFIFDKRSRKKSTQLDARYKQAFHWFSRASGQGNPEAEYYMGLMYSSGLGVNKSDSRAIQYYKRAAEAGVPEAQLEMGRALFYGLGVDKDFQASRKWLLKAEPSGIGEAMLYLGLLHFSGQGVPRDETIAARYFKRAAEAGVTRGLYRYALCLLNGYGIEKDKHEGFRVMRKAAGREDRDSEYMTGRCYYWGVGTKVDYRQALHWFKLAAAQDHKHAINYIGLMHRDGRLFPKSDMVAYGYFARAAELGSEEAKVNLASFMLEGRAVRKNKKMALEILKNSKTPLALNLLGIYYVEGDGKDIKKGVDFFKRAAAANSPEGLYNLARCYIDGIGVARDKTKAVTLLSRAVQRDHEKSRLLLRSIEKQ